MATKTSFLLLLLSILLLSATIALSSHREDERERELQQCRQQCQQQPHYDRGMRRQCEKHCGERHREQEREREHERQDPREKLRECRQQCRQGQQGQERRRECEQQCQEEYEQERGRGTNPQRQDPEERLEECRQQCRQGQQQQSQCERQCEDRYQQEKGSEQEGSSSSREEEQEEEGEEGGRSQRNNPYVFKRESFVHRVRTQHGSVRLLKNFLQKSKLFLGIANYRLVIFEANPRTFAVPKYSDADQLYFVVSGEGTVILIRNEESKEAHNVRRESHDVTQGAIIRVQAGTVVYIINNSKNQKLQIAKLVQPVSTPGRFEDFYVGGGENPETVYRTFSTSVLEAALNTQREKLERLFGRQREGAIVEASEEQIRGMIRHSSEGGPWPFGGQSSRKTFNLLNKRPDHSSERGKLYVADSNDYQELRDLDVHVTFANITRGSMMALFYETKATKIAIVTDGRGEFEMVCPHISSQSHKGQGREESEKEEEEEEEESEQQEEGQRYQKVRSRLTKGTVFVVPAGHPTAIIAARDENLQVVCFEVHARDSRKVFLAGKNNVVNEMEREAKELAFGVPSRLVDEVFGGSRDEVFLRAPEESRGRRQPLQSILDFPGF